MSTPLISVYMITYNQKEYIGRAIDSVLEQKTNFSFELIIGEDIMWLSVPFSMLPGDPQAVTETENVPGCLGTPCNLGFDVNDIRVVANAEFLTNNPTVATLFNLVEIPLNDIATQNARMISGESGEDDIRLHADEWIEANREQVDAWLASAREVTP